MASIHGSYRNVEETIRAVRLIGKTLHELGMALGHWYLDAPMSNSGRARVARGGTVALCGCRAAAIQSR